MRRRDSDETRCHASPTGPRRGWCDTWRTAALSGAGWPPTFEAVRDHASLPALGSPHLYLHLPFCASRCPHCPYTTALNDPARHRAYGDALRRELEAYVSRSDVPPVRSLYVGGGTPSLTPDLVELGIETIRPLFAPSPRSASRSTRAMGRRSSSTASGARGSRG